MWWQGCWWMGKSNEYKAPIESVMHYAADGTPLGYLWQTHPDFDPFAGWREHWNRSPDPKPKPKPKKESTTPPSIDYGYGQGRYMGD